MVCNTVGISGTPTPASTIDAVKEQNRLRRTLSSQNIPCRATMQRSRSDTHLCCAVKCAQAASTQPKLKTSNSIGIFPFQFSTSILPNSIRSFLFDPENTKDMTLVDDLEEATDVGEEMESRKANWVERLLELRTYWLNRQDKGNASGDEEAIEATIENEDEGVCEADYSSEDEEGGILTIDSDFFSKLLSKVSLNDTKHFAKLAFLCNMAYVIPEIKPDVLRRYYALHFVTSSLEKKAEAAAIKAKLDQDSIRIPVFPASDTKLSLESEQQRQLRPYVAYDIAASAASFVQSHTKGLTSSESEHHKGNNDVDNWGSGQQLREEGGSPSSRVYKSEVAAYVAASTMTAVVAAREEEKQKAARDLQSLHSSPCEWFICDDHDEHTRYFVIQGSDSLASWQANLFFEPTQFEETEALVHRGIYEAAKGIYEQFLPEILNHLDRHGEQAKFRFTGHSLGGSLSLLVNMMLLASKVLKPYHIHPVATFGSPFVFCGGRKILDELGLDENKIHCVMMHRDIVPRAFSCNYPAYVAQILKRLNGKFRSYPCLNKNKLLFSPMGKLFILQPDEKISPSHPFLPAGSALYALDMCQCPNPMGAIRAFLNSPHPLDTLSDPTAYGSEGSILRDHDSSNYLKAVNGVLRQHTRVVVKKARKQRHLLWPLLTSPSPHAWSNEQSLLNTTLTTKEIMSGV
ncbi:Fungal lipase-like domain [Dillenia turbinata]|uniref:Fungal lipase-like domain n=1 Tax=Dillenia turbinata TaxID=194707 RepID=A0AAN8UN44_9MAGN